MTTGFFFLLYMITYLAKCFYSTIKMKWSNNKIENIFSCIGAALGVTIIIVFSYYSGFYYHITGYAGNSYVFVVFASLGILGGIRLIIKYGYLEALYLAWIFFLIAMMDGFTQIGVVLNA